MTAVPDKMDELEIAAQRSKPHGWALWTRFAQAFVSGEASATTSQALTEGVLVALRNPPREV